MGAYKRDFDEIKYMFLLIKDDKLLEKHNESWEKLGNSIKKGLDIETVHDGKYPKTKKNIMTEKSAQNVHSDKISKEDYQCLCLSVILIDSVFRTGKKYYPQAFLQQCKYFIKKICLIILLTIKKFFLMILMKKTLMKKILMKKLRLKKFKYRKNILQCV